MYQVSKKMFISELCALLANEHFFGTPCMYICNVITYAYHYKSFAFHLKKITMPINTYVML